jgi:hypothetical protein
MWGAGGMEGPLGRPTLGGLFVLIANHPMVHAGQFVVVRRKPVAI